MVSKGIYRPANKTQILSALLCTYLGARMGLHVALDQLVLDDGGEVVALGWVLLGRLVTPTVAGAVAVAGTIGY